MLKENNSAWLMYQVCIKSLYCICNTKCFNSKNCFVSISCLTLFCIVTITQMWSGDTFWFFWFFDFFLTKHPKSILQISHGWLCLALLFWYIWDCTTSMHLFCVCHAGPCIWILAYIWEYMITWVLWENPVTINKDVSRMCQGGIYTAHGIVGQHQPHLLPHATQTPLGVRPLSTMSLSTLQDWQS